MYVTAALNLQKYPFTWEKTPFLYPIGLVALFILFSLLPDSVKEIIGHAPPLLLPLLVLTLILLFLPNLALGVAGNYLYFKFSKKKITEWKNTDKKTPLAKIGGENYWAAIIALLVSVVLTLSQC